MPALTLAWSSLGMNAGYLGAFDTKTEHEALLVEDESISIVFEC